MGIKDQLLRLKDNWLLVLLVVLLFLFVSFSSSSSTYLAQKVGLAGGGYDYGMAESAVYDSRGVVPMASGDFAPEVEERKITRNAFFQTEVKRGTFDDGVAKFKNIVKSSDSFILNEDVSKYGSDRKAYFTGFFTIKVDTEKYDSVIAQLKEIGEVQSFSENTDDITGQYTNWEINLEVEKSRLVRYQEMYQEAKDVSDKITLNDRIFDQERRVKYIEDFLNNLDKRIDYSTVRVTIREKRSDFADVVLIKFSALVKSLVDSFNSLLNLLFVVIPWAIAGGIVWIVWSRRGRKNKKSRR